jgi:prepilin-type N-terminal cleavage/methylation domain-containing protein
MQTKTSNLGFSLVEMLIAVVILGVITAQMFSLFNAQKRVYIANQRVLDVQEDTRLVLDLISFDARMAGFMIPRIAGVASVDGGVGPNNASDRLCISDSSYFDFPTATGTSDALDEAAKHLDAGRVVFANFNQVDVLGMDVDGDNGPIDYGAGRGIIISDGQNTHCARILTVTPPNQIVLAPGHEIPAGMMTIASQVRAVPALIYEVNENTLTLTRNSLTLATSVEDLQVEYWVDNAIVPPNGVIDGAA